MFVAWGAACYRKELSTLLIVNYLGIVRENDGAHAFS